MDLTPWSRWIGYLCVGLGKMGISGRYIERHKVLIFVWQGCQLYYLGPAGHWTGATPTSAIISASQAEDFQGGRFLRQEGQGQCQCAHCA